MIKNVAAILFLMIFFGGFLWLVGGAHFRSMEETKMSLVTISTNPTDVTVASHTCHYLLPNTLDKIMNRVMCWSCVDMADDIRNNFMISNPTDRCGGRGQVALSFTRKSH